MPTNVDGWARLLSRVGLSPEDAWGILYDGTSDIDLVIQHIEGYFERVYRDSGKLNPSGSNSTPATFGAQIPEATPADRAFDAARAFVGHLSPLSVHARYYKPSSTNPDAWQDPASLFAMAFVAWFDLTHLLTPEVRMEAQRVYPPCGASIKLGEAGGLEAYQRVALSAMRFPTVIEAVADELGNYFRRTVYNGRCHPLEPDQSRLTAEAMARATARQVSQGNPAEPIGWNGDLAELRVRETSAVVRARLGIRTYGDVVALMIREWNAQGRERGESALSLLRCDPIDFNDLWTRLTREAEAVKAAANKPNTSTIDPAGERAAEKMVRVPGGDDPKSANDEPLRKPAGWTKKELREEADGLSPTVFDRILKASGVKPSPKGGAGAHRRFSNLDLRKLIAAVEAGTYREKKNIVAAWRGLLPSD